MRLPNLLPAEYKKRYSFYVVLLYLRRFLYGQIVILLVIAGLLCLQLLVYKAKISGLKKAQAELENFEGGLDITAMQKLADSNNDNLKASAAILKARPTLSIILDELTKILPTGITLDSVKLLTSPASLDLKGRAATREQLVLLQSRLEKSQLLKTDYAPLSNLTEAQDGAFQFILSFDLKKIITIDD